MEEKSSAAKGRGSTHVVITWINEWNEY